MARVYDIKELAEYIRKSREIVFKAFQTAILEATVFGEGQAKKNAARVFTGTEFRPKTGFLQNAIFSGFHIDFFKRKVEGFVGVRSIKGNKGTKPYGRAHEYGAEIIPKKAQWLWIPIRNARTRQFENMTPSDFIAEKQRKGGEFAIIRARSGNGLVAVFNQAAKFNGSRKTADLIALFALKKRVVLPKRPYVRPAVEEASKKIPVLFAKHLADLTARAQ